MPIPKSKLKKLQAEKTLLEVEWLDITTKERIKKRTVDAIDSSLFLIIFKTYGYIYKYDDYAITLCREMEDSEEDDAEMDIMIIPLDNISSYSTYTKDKGGK